MADSPFLLAWAMGYSSSGYLEPGRWICHEVIIGKAMLYRNGYLLYYVIAGGTMADSHFLIAWAMGCQHREIWVHNSSG